MSDRIPSLDMADEFDRMIYGKTCWLADFAQGSRKRPDHEVEQKRRELSILKQAAFEYRASAERAGITREASHG